MRFLLQRTHLDDKRMFGLCAADRPDSMRALDQVAKSARTDAEPLNAASVRARCEGGDQEACLAYGLMAVCLCHRPPCILPTVAICDRALQSACWGQMYLNPAECANDSKFHPAVGIARKK